jgi:chromosome partitioning protein
MKIAVVSFKGGVGKTTTAVHLAAYFQTKAPTLLLDGDGTRNAMAWSQRGELPFKTALADQAAELMPQYTHTVIDTGQRPEMDDLRAAYAVCDLIVIPSAPASLDTDGLGQTIRAMREIGPDKFRVLLTKVARDAAKEVSEIRQLLAGLKAPILKAEIPMLKAFTKAATAGQTVNQVKDHNATRAWDSYVAAGKELKA